MIILTLTLLLLTSLCCTSTLAAGGDVAGAVQQTWTEAAKQIKSVVEKVVFPALDMILAIAFFVKQPCLPTSSTYTIHATIASSVISGRRVLIRLLIVLSSWLRSQ